MCGICGIIYSEPSRAVNESDLLAMRDAMTYRGPDDAGYYLGAGAGLGSRRLAILDLSERGHMPMSTPDGRYHIVYNGEIYNFEELRRGLASRGQVFRSHTDTEVLLYLYLEEGTAMLEKLNGMFAFAIWDATERKLFAARDRLGVKPFYYFLGKGSFYFASEQKALFAAGIPSHFDSSAWEELLCFRYVAGEKTPFEKIIRLLPGHYLVWENGKIEIERWWHLGGRAKMARDLATTGNSVQSFLEIFDSAVNLRRISDVPLGVFLSGGLDSSGIAASLAMQTKENVSSFTMGFSDPEFDESRLVKQVADRWNLTSHVFEVEPHDLLGLLERSSYFNDEPLAHGNDQYLYAIAKQAKSHVTVLLSGEGADETLGGYVRYRPLLYPQLFRLGRLLPASVYSFFPHGRARKLGRFLKLNFPEDFILFNTCNILPTELEKFGIQSKMDFSFRRAVLKEAQNYSPEPVRQAMYLDQHTFLCSLLDRNDRMTMGASIECRTPFLDYRMVEAAAALPTSELFGHWQGKWILRRAMRERLPADILKHKKWGFGVPWKRFLREDKILREVLNTLPDSEPLSTGPLDRKILRRSIDNFLAGADEDYLLLLQLLMLAIWYRVTFTKKISSGIRSVKS